MVKVKPIYPLDASWIVLFDMAGWSDPDPTRMWIWVYEYDLANPDYTPYGNLGGWCTNHAQATGLAADLAELSQVTVDLLPATHFAWWQGIDCPLIPRWNIYHGQRREPLMPVFHWDLWNTGPPPGYAW